MKIALCILAYNEIDCLKIILPKLSQPGPSTGYHSIHAVDGGSTDGSLEFFRHNGIEPLIQANKGRGEAIKLAFKVIHTDAIIFFSPDGNENPEDLNRFSEYLIDGADLVIASRMMATSFNEEDIHWWRPRKWANLCFNFLANTFFGSRHYFVSDSINGYRAIRRDAAGHLNLTASDYTIEYQMTIQSMKNKLKIAEFPTREGQRVAGNSQVLSLQAGLRFTKRLFQELLSK